MYTRRSSAQLGSVFLILLAIGAMFTQNAIAGGGGSGHPAARADLRVLPDVHMVHISTWAMIMPIGHEQAVSFMLSQTDTVNGWRVPGEHFAVGEMVISGAIANLSFNEEMIVVTNVGAVTILPGEVHLFGNATLAARYGFDSFGNNALGPNACICRCGGDIEAYEHNPPCSQLNGNGPCIDNSTTPVSTSTLSDCTAGYAPKNRKNGPINESAISNISPN